MVLKHGCALRALSWVSITVHAYFRSDESRLSAPREKVGGPVRTCKQSLKPKIVVAFAGCVAIVTWKDLPCLGSTRCVQDLAVLARDDAQILSISFGTPLWLEFFQICVTSPQSVYLESLIWQAALGRRCADTTSLQTE